MGPLESSVRAVASILLATSLGLQLTCWVWNKWFATVLRPAPEPPPLPAEPVEDVHGQRLAPIELTTHVPGNGVLQPNFRRALAACFLYYGCTFLACAVMWFVLDFVAGDDWTAFAWVAAIPMLFLATCLINWSFLETTIPHALGVTALLAPTATLLGLFFVWLTSLIS